MKRPGTEYAELFAEAFEEFRESGDALTLCKYIEGVPKKINNSDYYLVNHSEEIDCLFSESDTVVDDQNYYQADKIIGFPYCNLSKNPVDNGIFEEIDTGDRWIITSILSIDPIKAYIQCACTRLYDTGKTAIYATAKNVLNLTVNPYTLVSDDMFWANSATGATQYPLTDSYTSIPLSDFGPPVTDLTSRAGQRVRFVYSASIQVEAVGINGGDCTFQLQRSTEPDGDLEIWSNLPNLIAPLTLNPAEKNKYTFFFTDQIPNGISSGVALKYRLIAKRSSADFAVTVHTDNINPTVTIDAQFNYPEFSEIAAYSIVSISIVPSAEAGVGSGAAVSNAVQVSDSAEADVGSGAAVSNAVQLSDSAEAAGVGYGTAASNAVQVSDSAEAAGVGSGATAPDAVQMSDSARADVGSGTAASNAVQVSNSAEAIVADLLWTAPPISPDAVELGLTYDEVNGSTVTIPANTSGNLNVQFVYSASLSLLAIGVDGGDCTFQLQKSEAGGSWVDVIGEKADIIFASQNQENRSTFDLYDAYPSGVPVDTEIQYRLVGKTNITGAEVEIHSSLIDPDNIDPACSIAAEYYA